MANGLDYFQQGTQIGAGLGALGDARDARKLGEQTRALGSRMLNVGGQETRDSQLQAETELAALNPDTHQKFVKSREALDVSRLADQKEAVDRIAALSENLIKSQDLPLTLQSSSKLLRSMGEDDTADILDGMYEEALVNPDSVKEQINMYGTQAGEYSKAFDEMRKNNAEVDKTFRTKELENASKYANKIEDKSSETVRSYKLIDNLINEAKTNPDKRIINAAAITAIAKIVAPEAVNESDIARYSGATDPLAAAYQVYKGNQAVTNALNTSVDALGFINIENLRGIANSAAGATYDSLNNELEASIERGKRGGMKDEYLNTYFEGNNSFNALGDLIGKERKGADEGQIMIDANGVKARVFKDGRIEEIQ